MEDRLLHLSEEQITRYIKRDLAPNDLLQSDDHLAACSVCSARLRGLPADALVLNMGPTTVNHEHLSYDQMESYVEDRLDPVAREIADVHIDVCRSCRSDVTELAAMQRLVEEDPRRQRTAPQTDGAPKPGRKFNFFSLNPLTRISLAAGALLLATVVIGYFALRSMNGPIEISTVSVQPVPAVTPPPGPDSSDSGAPPVSASNVFANSATGIPVDSLPEGVRQAIARTTLRLPNELKELEGGQGTLMGGTDEIPFTLSSPVGKAVLSAQPKLGWKPLPGADGYSVEIYDGGFQLVASSGNIGVTTWQPGKPLPRGRTYSWQVTAFRDGKEIKSPVRPAPDARFLIVSSRAASEITETRQKAPRNHLALGVAYANAGLLDEAAREFRKELSINPGSTPARTFLRQISAR